MDSITCLLIMLLALSTLLHRSYLLWLLVIDSGVYAWLGSRMTEPYPSYLLMVPLILWLTGSALRLVSQFETQIHAHSREKCSLRNLNFHFQLLVTSIWTGNFFLNIRMAQKSISCFSDPWNNVRNIIQVPTVVIFCIFLFPPGKASNMGRSSGREAL